MPTQCLATANSRPAWSLSVDFAVCNKGNVWRANSVLFSCWHSFVEGDTPCHAITSGPPLTGSQAVSSLHQCLHHTVQWFPSQCQCVKILSLILHNNKLSMGLVGYPWPHPSTPSNGIGTIPPPPPLLSLSLPVVSHSYPFHFRCSHCLFLSVLFPL